MCLLVTQSAIITHSTQLLRSALSQAQQHGQVSVACLFTLSYIFWPVNGGICFALHWVKPGSVDRSIVQETWALCPCFYAASSHLSTLGSLCWKLNKCVRQYDSASPGGGRSVAFRMDNDHRSADVCICWQYKGTCRVSTWKKGPLRIAGNGITTPRSCQWKNHSAYQARKRSHFCTKYRGTPSPKEREKKSWMRFRIPHDFIEVTKAYVRTCWVASTHDNVTVHRVPIQQ